MTTWYELGLRSESEVWRSIRGRRANPPVPEGSPARTSTFQAALEQAEQQFRAARQIDPESRALNLFYGLSQAGRAIAASSRALSNSDWRLSGHGLQCQDEQGVSARNPGASRLRVHRSPHSSFGRLSTVLASAQPEELLLGVLWPMIYDTHVGPEFPHDLWRRPLLVRPDRERHPNSGSMTQSASIELPEDIRKVAVYERPALRDYLAQYPALSGWLETLPWGGAVDWPGGDTEFKLWWPAPAGTSTVHALDGGLAEYRGRMLAMPTVGATGMDMHPLMVWWAVLFGLSMATRYMPDVWTELIDVNRSPYATSIEYLLDAALTAVPDLIDSTISEVSQP